MISTCIISGHRTNNRSRTFCFWSKNYEVFQCTLYAFVAIIQGLVLVIFRMIIRFMILFVEELAAYVKYLCLSILCNVYKYFIFYYNIFESL